MIENEHVGYDDQEILDDACANFQALLAERIGAGEDLQSYDHMSTCERCRALVRDLETIARVARELMGVEEEPPKDLWFDIENAIKRDVSGEADAPAIS